MSKKSPAPNPFGGWSKKGSNRERPRTRPAGSRGSPFAEMPPRSAAGSCSSSLGLRQGADPDGSISFCAQQEQGLRAPMIWATAWSLTTQVICLLILLTFCWTCWSAYPTAAWMLPCPPSSFETWTGNSTVVEFTSVCPTASRGPLWLRFVPFQAVMTTMGGTSMPASSSWSSI